MSSPDPDAWLSRDPLPDTPVDRLADWLDEAFAARRQPNPHAMTLATADDEGMPQARIVLCKAIEREPGTIVFYTNRTSRKGRALAARPRAAVVFHWGPQERQARIEGPVTAVSDAESDAYFATRPAEAQLSAWASEQSEPIASRAALEARMAEAEARFGVRADPTAPGAVPRPPTWGGYRLHIARLELWRSGGAGCTTGRSGSAPSPPRRTASAPGPGGRVVSSPEPRRSPRRAGAPAARPRKGKARSRLRRSGPPWEGDIWLFTE